MSKVIRVLLWFCFTSLYDWLKPFAPLSWPIRSKTQTNQSRLARARTRFPALDAGNMYLLQVLIGSLGNLCLLWLAGVITLVWFYDTFEKRSKSDCSHLHPPRANCTTRSFSSWLSFNMVVRTGTNCSRSLGRHLRNCNMTFFRYSRFADSFSRSWFLSSLDLNRWNKTKFNPQLYRKGSTYYTDR